MQDNPDLSQHQRRVQANFGRAAADYVTSQPHAKGADLTRLVELLDPQPAWHVLDVATGGGHTALALAPRVAHVVASDITPQMLTAAADLARQRGIANISFEPADAEALPFADGSFDAVTCRVAAHHFGDVFRFLQASARVLRPGGVLGIVDNSVPDGADGAYINAFEALRDPGHVACLSAEAWQQELFAAGFELLHLEQSRIELDFDDWTARMRVAPADVTRLRALLLQAPAGAAAILTPQFAGARMTFQLLRVVLIARKGQLQA